MDKQEFIENLESFVKNYQSSNIINDIDKNKILSYSTAWNKEDIMEDLIKRVDEHRLYEEEDFPYLHYVSKFLSVIPKAINTAKTKNSIQEVDFSLD